MCVRACDCECVRACDCVYTDVCVCAWHVHVSACARLCGCVRAFAGVNVCVEKERKFMKAYRVFSKIDIKARFSGQTAKFEAVDSFDLLYQLNKNLLFGNLTYQCNAKLSPVADGHIDCLGPGRLGAYGMH